jgi:hypothetical protein
MRTTLDLDQNLLRQASRLGRLRTTTELIHASLKLFIQRKRLEGLTALGGKGRLKVSKKRLAQMRSDV